MDHLMVVVGNDVKKAQQLFQYASKKLTTVATAEEQKLTKVHNAIVESLRAWFTKAREVQGNGRPSNKLRKALQAVITAISTAPELGAVSMASVANAVNLAAGGANQLQARKIAADSFLDEGLLESLFDDRCKRRNDGISAEQIEWLIEHCWLSDEFTRPSEQAKHEVFDPKSRAADREHHRLRWLEWPLCGPHGFYATVQTKGKERWGEDFHMSSTFIREHRPFWVKDPMRDVCLCRSVALPNCIPLPAPHKCLPLPISK